MILVLLIFAAPTLQVVLLILKGMNKISIPRGIITLIMFVLGIVFSFVAASTVAKHIPISPGGIRCGTGIAAILIGGIFINFVAVSVIGIIGYLVSRLNQTAL